MNYIVCQSFRVRSIKVGNKIEYSSYATLIATIVRLFRRGRNVMYFIVTCLLRSSYQIYCSIRCILTPEQYCLFAHLYTYLCYYLYLVFSYAIGYFVFSLTIIPFFVTSKTILNCTFLEHTSTVDDHTIYASNSSSTWKSGSILYKGKSLPTKVNFFEVLRYLTYELATQQPSVELELCEIGVIGEYFINRKH